MLKTVHFVSVPRWRIESKSPHCGVSVSVWQNWQEKRYYCQELLFQNSAFFPGEETTTIANRMPVENNFWRLFETKFSNDFRPNSTSWITWRITLSRPVVFKTPNKKRSIEVIIPRACCQLRSLLDLGVSCQADCRNLLEFILPDRTSFHPPPPPKNVPFAMMQMMEDNA